MSAMPARTPWALEGATNPTLLRLHVGVALTTETIVTCPPGAAPAPVDRLLEIEAIRSLDVHRYRVRLNLRLGAGRAETQRHAAEVLAHAWGPAVPLAPDPGPRAFAAALGGPRAVAESPAMAAGHPVLAAVFEVRGVSEAIAGEGLVLVRLGRLFAWDDAEGPVAAAIAQRAGTPGSASG
jgi:hypothetical protein